MQSQRSHPASRGFTLIEVMVVMAIMAGAYFVGLPLLTDKSSKKNLTAEAAAAETYADAMNRARRKAVEVNEPVRLALTADNGWEMSWRKSGEVFESRPGPGKELSVTTQPEQIRAISFNGIGMIVTGNDFAAAMRNLDVRRVDSGAGYRVVTPLSGQIRIESIIASGT